MSPEYATLGQLSTKVDVYSFGILYLKLLVEGRPYFKMQRTTYTLLNG